MTDEEKQELIILLEEEVAEQKIKIMHMEARCKKLESKIADLTMIAAGPRRGMPWN